MDKINYQPDKYWTKVANEISNRGGDNYLAGDDEPYYRYKRRKFVGLLLETRFTGKRVLEVGCGPGGNLLEILALKPISLAGIDISDEMVKLAKTNLKDHPVEIIKTNGVSIPFENNSMDVVFTATVLQHNTDEKMLQKLVNEICRVSNRAVVLFERIEPESKGNESCQGRTVEFYKDLLSINGFELSEVKYLPISVSYYVCGAIRKIFNKKSRKEGEKPSWISVILQHIVLPLTSVIDKLWIEKRDVARMIFRKKSD